MMKETDVVQWLPRTEAIQWLVAATEAIQMLTAMCPDPEAAEAKIRAVWVDAYQQAGQPIPEWLLGPAAKAFLDGSVDRE